MAEWIALYDEHGTVSDGERTRLGRRLALYCLVSLQLCASILVGKRLQAHSASDGQGWKSFSCWRRGLGITIEPICFMLRIEATVLSLPIL